MNDQEDHDLLIRIETKLDIMMTDYGQLKDRVTALERSSDKQSGFISGGKFLWSLMTSIPVGVVAFILGGNK